MNRYINRLQCRLKYCISGVFRNLRRGARRHISGDVHFQKRSNFSIFFHIKYYYKNVDLQRRGLRRKGLNTWGRAIVRAGH